MHFPRSRAITVIGLAISMMLPGLAAWQGVAAQVATPVVDLNTTLPAQPGGTLRTLDSENPRFVSATLSLAAANSGPSTA